jgi:hypothetical protein
MRISIEKLVVLLAVAFLSTGLAQAQQSTTAGGGDATGSGGTMAYSLGQVEFTTNANGVGIAAQGVQHAYETFTIGIVQTTLNASLTAFPIPAKENLTLKIIDYNEKKLSYSLNDMHGRVVLFDQIVGQLTEINMINMAAESYSLVVFYDGQIVKYIQIIKTN